MYVGAVCACSIVVNAPLFFTIIPARSQRRILQRDIEAIWAAVHLALTEEKVK